MTSSLIAEPEDADYPPSQLLARRIREVVAGRQISGTRLAEAIEMDQRAFSRRYRGVTPWTVDELYAVAGALAMELGDLLPRLDSNQQPCVIPSVQVSTDVAPAAEHLATVTPLHPGHAARLTPRGPIIQPNPSNPTRPAIVGASTGVSAAVPPGTAADAQSPVTHLDDYRARRRGEATGRTA